MNCWIISNQITYKMAMMRSYAAIILQSKFGLHSVYCDCLLLLPLFLLVVRIVHDGRECVCVCLVYYIRFHLYQWPYHFNAIKYFVSIKSISLYLLIHWHSCAFFSILLFVDFTLHFPYYYFILSDSECVCVCSNCSLECF